MGPRRKSRPRGGDRISYDEAAALLGISKATLVQWVKDERMPAWKTPKGYHKLWRHVVMEFVEDFNKT